MSTLSLKKWWYIARPHTLFASLAPMLVVSAALLHEKTIEFFPLLLCYFVALSAQIASNIANDYFDYKKGGDTSERIGFRRVLAEGEVKPSQMLMALFIVIAFCALSGLILAFIKGWELLWIGLAVLVALLAYSAGPFPLSRQGFGDIAVVLFFGLVPILGTYYAIVGDVPIYLVFIAMAIGLWEANILVVNNYRDYDEDLSVGKKTLIVRIGRRSGPFLYLLNGVLASLMVFVGLLLDHSYWGAFLSFLITLLFTLLWTYVIYKVKPTQLNRVLVQTSRISMLLAILYGFCLVV